MSKWGYVDAGTAKRKFEADANEAAKMVADMASCVIDQEKEINQLKNDLINSRMSEGGAKAAAARMEGYIERVRETDTKPKKANKP